ncbi:MAG: 4'-phosphopantetheinyl transferase family protein [Candidatus Fimenecus sp.]
MTSVYFFDYTDESLNLPETFPENVISHCKKGESLAAAAALIDMGVLNLHYEKNGKPLADNCFVSISHSENMIAVCTSDKPVGIDIEYIDDSRNFCRLAERFFKDSELEFFNRRKDAVSFYEIWTKKEAYSKILGTGTGEIFKGFDVFSLNDVVFHTEQANDYIITLCEKAG